MYLQFTFILDTSNLTDMYVYVQVRTSNVQLCF